VTENKANAPPRRFLSRVTVAFGVFVGGFLLARLGEANDAPALITIGLVVAVPAIFYAGGSVFWNRLVRRRKGVPND
jgi:1,4-dihydroxy-2-naphthoate octaprenyltransferase